MRASVGVAFALLLLACGGKLAPEDGSASSAVPGGVDDDDDHDDVTPGKKTKHPRDDDDVVSSDDDATKDPTLPTDLADPEAAKICAARSAVQPGKASETSSAATSLINGADRVSASIGRSMRQPDGQYRTAMTLTFGAAPRFVEDPTHGRTRIDVGSAYTVATYSPTPRPDAFSTGTDESILIASVSSWKQECSEDGTSSGGGAGAGGDGLNGSLTITMRTASRIAGVLETKSGSGVITVTFDAPIVPVDGSPPVSKVCCLKQ